MNTHDITPTDPAAGTPSIAASPRTAAAGGTLASARRHLWLLVLPIAFVTYAASFNDRPIIDEKHSVLAEADAANFALLIREFSLTRIYGDPFNTDQRSIGDNAQKHKIHHTLYAILAGYSYKVLASAYSVVGLTPRQALYSINAFVTCLNIVLVFLLLRRFNPRGNPLLPFLVFYAGALSTWLYASVPESWPFTATLVLTFLWLLTSRRVTPPVIAAFVGVAMLNNVTLGALLGLVAVAQARRASSVGPLVLQMSKLTAITLGVWIGGLLTLSLFDPTLRPDRFMAYTFWFRDYVGADLPFYSPYVWKSILSNLFVNSIVSQQPDSMVPQEALLFTIQGSRLGLAATMIYLALVVVVAVRAIRDLRAAGPAAGRRWMVLDDDIIYPLLYCGFMATISLTLCYCGAFLYSTVVVPLLTIVMCRFIDLSKRGQALLFAGTLTLLLINNIVQVLVFRTALAEMV